jgi:hypothetical protein
MADDKSQKDQVKRSDEQLENRIDPEKVIPDPEQVERDRKEEEEIYGDRKNRKAS